MSRKRTIYSAEFKSKLVLEVLKNEKTLQEIASTNNITPKNLQNFSTVIFPTIFVSISFCSCAADSSSLYSLTALAGSIAISAFSRKIFRNGLKKS
jgi:putative transposase